MEPSSEHEVALRSTAHRVYLVRREPAQSLPPPGLVTTFRIWGSAVPTSTTTTTTTTPPPSPHRDPRRSPRAYDAASPRPTPTPAPGDSTFPAPGLCARGGGGGGGGGGDRDLPEPLRACGEPVVFRTWVRHHGTVRTLRLPQGRVLASRSDSGAWRWAWLPCSGW
uniref:Poly(U)-specific endoribonuclease homolog n=1 Tax=Petromyzon marinus TaxID=7757 RepID=A0AAJ7TVZ2_PETMA|nr:poly(U)-specific endoribonuclease homolog [Petromyzon marinus]